MKTFSQLRKELDSGKIGNFYVFTGEEKEVMRQYINRIAPDVQEMQTAEQLWKKLTNKGLFETQGQYILYNSEEVQSIAHDKLLRQIGANTLILVYDSIDKRKKFFKAVDKYTTEFKKFEDKQLIGYIQSRVDIRPDLAFVIAKACNNDIGQIDIELHKLSHAGEITLELLEDVLVPMLDDQIFEMIDAVAIKDGNKAFRIYYDLMEQRESPIKIISLLYMKFRQIFLVQSYFNLSEKEIMEKTGLNWGQIKFTRNVVGKFSAGEILDHLETIQEIEVAVKTGRVEMFTGTENLILNILK